jgi:MEMO1 family protein
MNAADKPAVRGVEPLPIRRDGEVFFVLRDPLALGPSIAVSAGACFLLQFLDGEHTCAEVAAGVKSELGLTITQEDVHRLVAALDEALLLHGPRFEAALAKRRDDYTALRVRDSRAHYPDPAALRTAIEQILARGGAAPLREVHGLIAPHLDYERGAPCYGDAYATLSKAPPAERYVILGTNHAGLAPGVVATTKDFLTPLGEVPVDRAFLTRLEERLGAPLTEHEVDHLGEHSVELQVHFLQVLAAGRPFEIVPVLCPDACLAEAAAEARPKRRRSQAGAAEPGLRDFATALGEAVRTDGRSTVIIAGADLSHVGQRFGEEEPTTPEFLEQVARSDRVLMKLWEERREAEFVARLAASGNPTRICSSGCIYALLTALPNRPCRVLSYHQAVNFEAETHVTCAAAVVGAGEL